MGLSSNSPVVLTVVTSGQSFARSFSVKVGRSLCICVSYLCLYLYFMPLFVTSARSSLVKVENLTRSSVKDYLSIDPTNYTSSTKTLTSLDRSIDSIFEHNLSWTLNYPWDLTSNWDEPLLYFNLALYNVAFLKDRILQQFGIGHYSKSQWASLSHLELYASTHISPEKAGL